MAAYHVVWECVVELAVARCASSECFKVFQKCFKRVLCEITCAFVG